VNRLNEAGEGGTPGGRLGPDKLDGQEQVVQLQEAVGGIVGGLGFHAVKVGQLGAAGEGVVAWH